ncbi:hypothetical protein [Thalassolituus sp.]|uniref:hypothetical protein n=1 Tax=Thalassolituus sp. TaxID=2030822 RepID=UPI00351618A1|nr:MAG: hypothetical protein CSH36_02675 [Thalassolituus sp.]
MPNFLFLRALAVFALVTASSAFAEDVQTTEIDDSIPWEEVKTGKEIGEISTWRRAIPDADVKQFRGEVIIRHPALHVLLTIDNPDDLEKWVYFCRSSKGVPPEYSYMEYKGVWPVASRYVTLKSKSWIDDDVIYINSRNIDNIGPEPRNMVKIQEFNNLFEITPLGPELTKIRFTTFVDLAGRLPSWLANAVSSRAPDVTLSGLRDLLNKGEWDYSTATVGDLSSVAKDKAGLQKLLDKVAEKAADDSDPLDPDDD